MSVVFYVDSRKVDIIAARVCPEHTLALLALTALSADKHEFSVKT